MKKLLIFMLVLGMASAANAVLTDIQIDVAGSHVGTSFDVVVGQTISLEIYSGNTDTGLAYLGFEDNGLYTFGTPVVTPNAGDKGSVFGPYVWEGYNEVELTVSKTASGTVTPGTMLLWPITAGSSVGTIDVYLQDEDVLTKDTLTLNIIPEPMTVLLLGLGGLFLRRRKK